MAGMEYTTVAGCAGSFLDRRVPHARGLARQASSLMQTFHTNRNEIPWLKLIAYVVGIWLGVHGAIGLGTDFESATAWAVIKQEAFHGVCMLWGVLVCVAARFRYRGGLWSVAGAFLLGAAVINSCLVVVVQVKGLELASPISFYFWTALLWATGGVLAVIGHLRHRRKNMPVPDTAPPVLRSNIAEGGELPPTAP